MKISIENNEALTLFELSIHFIQQKKGRLKIQYLCSAAGKHSVKLAETGKTVENRQITVVME